MDLHPAVAHLAPLLGTWRGGGRGHYPTIDPFEYTEEVTFGHVGKPFLAYSQRTKGVDGAPLHAECGYWRPTGEWGLELLIVHPSGIAEILVGEVAETHFGLVVMLEAGAADGAEASGAGRRRGRRRRGGRRRGSPRGGRRRGSGRRGSGRRGSGRRGGRHGYAGGRRGTHRHQREPGGPGPHRQAGGRHRAPHLRRRRHDALRRAHGRCGPPHDPPPGSHPPPQRLTLEVIPAESLPSGQHDPSSGSHDPSSRRRPGSTAQHVDPRSPRLHSSSAPLGGAAVRGGAAGRRSGAGRGGGPGRGGAAVRRCGAG